MIGFSQRSKEFRSFYPLGSRAVKAHRKDEVVFRLFGNGYKTDKDAYRYNFSRTSCARNAQNMANDYLVALRDLDGNQGMIQQSVADVVSSDSPHIRCGSELRRGLQERDVPRFSEKNLRKVIYRPFVKQYLYSDNMFSQGPGLSMSIFPHESSQNQVICVTGIGSNNPFSTLMVDVIPDLELISRCQCFPRYHFALTQGSPSTFQGIELGLNRLDNITDNALLTFRMRYANNAISKDDIFYYVYGILHSPLYRRRFANDLPKDLPRIPFAGDFKAFVCAGRELADLHVGYETCQEYNLLTKWTGSNNPSSRDSRIGNRSMYFSDKEKTRLCINEMVTLQGIPEAAHRYSVNGRTPLEWVIDRYRVNGDSEGGITDDPNDWFSNPTEILPTIRRIVYVATESVRIIESLPKPFDPINDSFVNVSKFEKEALRLSALVAASAHEEDDQAFIDAVTAGNDE